MRKLLRFALAFVCSAALAQETAPDALIRSVTAEVLAAIRQDAAIRAGDAAHIDALVQAKILPHFDFTRATRLAVGVGWRRATAAQREQLTAQFQRLLVRTYSSALSSYREQKIDVLPARMRPGDDEVTVRSRVEQSGQAPITIDYSLERAGGEWKVFDVSVDGMSLVQNYRTTFAQEIDNHGIDGLIQRLAAKNAGA